MRRKSRSSALFRADRLYYLSDRLETPFVDNMSTWLRTGWLDGNPNFIQARVTTMWFPLEPRVNPRHVAMKDKNNNDHALPMGPIGVAVNGVAFFNPFDHLLDAADSGAWPRCSGQAVVVARLPTAPTRHGRIPE